tara:strand:- start:734 stop:1084 length:351 start_codon:yes stop_codon:yes gene_type:complete
VREAIHNIKGERDRTMTMNKEVKKAKKELERLIRLIRKYAHVYCEAYYEKQNEFLISDRMHRWEVEFMTFENAWVLQDNHLAESFHDPIKVEAWKQYMADNPGTHKDMTFADLISG